MRLVPRFFVPDAYWWRCILYGAVASRDARSRSAVWPLLHLHFLKRHFTFGPGTSLAASERCAPVYGAGRLPSSLARNYRPTPVRLLPDANPTMRSYSTAPRAAQSDRERVRNLDHRRKLAQALSCVPLHCPMRRLWPLQDADMICLSYPISSLSHDDAALRHCSSVGQP